MLKKIIVIGLLSTALLSCEEPNNDTIWGIWNSGKVTSNKYAYTIPFFKKYYKVEDGYLIISKKENYKGAIRDLSENLFIIDISGKHPVYILKVKLIDNEFENNKEVEKNYYGDIKVHFIDKNAIWFENALSDELNNIFKVRHFNLEFGPDKIFYKAEEVDKQMPKNRGELE